MRGHNATLKTIEVTLPASLAWTKLVDANPSRMYLMIQNDNANHHIKIGFGSNTVAPTVGFDLAGSSQQGHVDTIFEFGVAPTNAVWAKTLNASDHLLQVVYDD